MNLILWPLSLLCLLAGVWVSVLNWGVVWTGLRGAERIPSWIPVMGGGLASLGFWLLPAPDVSVFWWVPLLADWGCVPGFIHTVGWHAVHYFRGSPEP